MWARCLIAVFSSWILVTQAATTLPGDPLFNAQTGAYSAVNLQAAWDVTTGDNSVTVAVIDDAIEIDHPDLAGNVSSASYDIEQQDSNPSPEMCGFGPQLAKEKHGTGVAGVLAAVGNNGIGIAGVNWRVNLLAVRLGCAIRSQAVLAAIRYAVNRGARIINASFASYDLYDPQTRAEIAHLLEANDALLVVSAANTHGNNDYFPMDPGAIDSPNIIVVAAADNTGKLTHWSHYGVTSVDLAAPGVGILTTALNGEYQRQTGTSYAAPMVAGAAALLLARNPGLSARELKAALMASTLDLRNGRPSGRRQLPLGKLASDGFLNVQAALAQIAQPKPVPVLHRIEVDDASLGNGNGVIDSDEHFSLNLVVENLWPDTGPAGMSMTLRSTSSGIVIEDAAKPLVFQEDGKGRLLASQSFQVRVGVINGHRRFSFDAYIDAGDETVVRSFELEAGPLRNGELVSGVIQKNEFDDFQTFTLDVPATAKSVVFELRHQGGALGRMPDLVVAQGRRPKLQMNASDSRVRRGPGLAYYRADVSSFRDTTWYAVVYNRMLADNTDPGARRSFSIRGCYLTEGQAQPAPLDFAIQVENTTVRPGERVVLSAPLQLDEDSFFWWEVIGNNGPNNAMPVPSLRDADTLRPSFQAPASGSFIFRLTVSDALCRHASSEVEITVQEETNLQVGFTLNPVSIDDAVEGRDLQRFVQPIIVEANGVPSEVVGFWLAESPPGVWLDNGILRWPNAGPAGVYELTFGARTGDGTTHFAQMRITVKKAGDVFAASGAPRGGGCSLGAQAPDPVLPGLTLASLLFLRRGR